MGILDDLKEQALKTEVDHTAKLERLASLLQDMNKTVNEKMNSSTDQTAKPLQVSEMEALEQHLSTLEITERDTRRDHNVVRNLAFKHRTDRYRSIPKAHEQTLAWIFDPKNSNGKGALLLEWLRGGQGIFWVSGKPGSGKSTLMKFLADSPQTQVELSQWSREKSVITTSHYFWWSGTAMQKSQEGLLRTILHGVFRRCPDLIQSTCYRRWASLSDEASDEEDRHWSLDELRSVFKSIARHPELKVKFCIFVDGLDEYDGDHAAICDTFKSLVGSSPDIKMCVSSRPWNEFQQAFGLSRWSIYVHDLTREDIRRYARSRLSEHPSWGKVAERSPEVRELIELIVQRAEGVFLWVFLVTKRLRDGLNNHDSLTDLIRRVESFPPDLEKFFRDMLESVDNFYHEKMSTTLQIALTAKEPLNLSIYAFHEQEFDVGPDYAINLPISKFSDELIQEQHATIQHRLNGWCKGLMEVHGHSVHFLHRTVVDFLKTRGMSEFLENKTPAGFSSTLSILKAYTAWFKTGKDFGQLTMNMDGRCGEAFSIPRIQQVLQAASEIESSIDSMSPIHEDVAKHIDAVEHSFSKMQDAGDITFKSDSYIKNSHAWFRVHLLQAGLAGYLSKKLAEVPDYFQGLGRPAISFVLNAGFGWGSKTGHLQPEKIFETLRCLLENGDNLNQTYTETVYRIPRTPFTSLLSFAVPWNEDRTQIITSEWTLPIIRNRTISQFLQYGADPSSKICRSRGSFPKFSTAWIDLLLLSFHFDADSKIEGPYLQELDSFLSCGADLQSEGIYTDISGVLAGDGLLAHQAFFAQLDQPRTGASTRHNTRILGEVSKRLLRQIRDEPEELKSAWKIIDRNLPHAVCDRLRTEWKADLEVTDRPERKKRRSKHREKDGRPSKRAKKGAR